MSATDELLPIPPQPEISEGNKVFHQKAYDLYKWMRTKLGPAIIEVSNLLRNAVTGAFTATSSTPMEISVGEKSLNISAGRSFMPGTPARVARTSDPSKYVDGITKTYDPGTGDFVFDGITPNGAGTFTDWSISIIPSSGGGLASLFTNKFTGLQSLANEVTVASATVIDLTAAGSNQFKLTGSEVVETINMPQGAVIKGRAAGTPTLKNSATLIVQGGADYVCEAKDKLTCTKDGDGNVHVEINRVNGKPVVMRPTVRQCILSGPVDSNGLPNYGATIGGLTTLTVSGTLIITSSNGEVDNTFQVTNPQWTGLNANGTRELWIDTVTGVTGHTANLCNYQFGGVYSIASDQHTYNIQEAIMKVGNGTTVNQVNRVFVGRCVIAGGVVTSVVWYSLKGKYISDEFNFVNNTTYSKNHNLGYPVEQIVTKFYGYNAAAGWSDHVLAFGGSYPYPSFSHTSLSMDIFIASAGLIIKSTAYTSGKLRFAAKRSW